MWFSSSQLWETFVNVRMSTYQECVQAGMGTMCRSNLTHTKCTNLTMNYEKSQGEERSRSDMCFPLSLWITMLNYQGKCLLPHKTAQLCTVAPFWATHGEGKDQLLFVWLASCEAVLLQEVVDQKPCHGHLLISSLATAATAATAATVCLVVSASNMLIDWDHLK